MEKDLVVTVKNDEKTIILLEDKRIVELHKEKKNQKFSVGDIYIGIVKKILPNLNAAFVDIGHEKEAFLHYNDLGLKFLSYRRFLRNLFNNKNFYKEYESQNFLDDIPRNGKITDILVPGEKIIVQILKEPISSKGPRVTADISIAGRNLVLIPFSNRVFISQKIKEKEERERLKNLVKSFLPNNYGIIIRTVAKNRRASVLEEEFNSLKNKWIDLLKNIPRIQAPALIMSELATTSALLRDILNTSFTSIWVDDKNTFLEIKDFLNAISPESLKIVKFYNNKDKDLLEHLGISKQIKTSFGKIVALKKGAYLIFEKTEALYVIDVNSGVRPLNANDQESNAFEVNLLAVDEIARQIRLRDLGGIIVIDFIDMHDQKHRNEIYKRMLAAMENDRAKHTILPLSKFGLMQITRQRIRPEVVIDNSEVCPVCDGTGQVMPSVFIIDEIEQTLKNIVEEKKIRNIRLLVHSFIHAFLTKGFIFSIRFKWMLKYKIFLKVVEQKDYFYMEYNFCDRKGKSIDL